MRVFGFDGLTALVGVFLAASVSVSAVAAETPTKSIHLSPRHSGAASSVVAESNILATSSLSRRETGGSYLLGSRLGKARYGSHGLTHLAGYSYHGQPSYRFGKNSKAQYRSGGLQCVPFARAASGIELKGNAANWWDAAEGVYDRGARPESGSVLNFRAIGRMHLGHVAVVTAVLDSRQIEIEHANWAGPGAAKGGISHNIPVIDVSAENNWSAVRVGLGRTGEYGSVYPTYGFIYDRPDRGTMEANTGANIGTNRLARGNSTAAFDEVAQASTRPRLSNLLDANYTGDAPSHSLR